MLYECHFMLSSGFTMIKEIEFEGTPSRTRKMRQFPRLSMVDLSNTSEPSQIVEARDIDFHLEHAFRAHHKQIAYYMET